MAKSDVHSKAMVLLLLLIVTPIMGFCNSMFCYSLFCVHSSFAIILMEKERAGCFA